MIEAFAAVGLVSAITQLVEFGLKIINRLNETHSNAGDLPKAYQGVQTELPLLIDILQRTKDQTGPDQVSDGTRQALVPVIEGCCAQVKVLDSILARTLPVADDSWRKRGVKAFSSVYQEKKIEHLVTKLHDYIQILTYHEITKFSTLPSPMPQVESYYEVPARRVQRFIGREDVLSDIDHIYDTNTKSKPVTLVLRGMGGQGKTQLALEYCRRAHESRRFPTIFWVDSSSETTAKRGLGNIFEAIKPSHQVFPDNESRIRHVKMRLKSWQSPWLVVFDNYDNPSAFPNVRNYMPSGAEGSLLVTSRHADSERLGITIEIASMEEDDALRLLLKRAGLESNPDNLKYGHLAVERLGYHALAIDQSAAYIRKRRLPLRDFVDHYNARKERVLKEIPKFWEYRRNLNDAESDTAMSVFTTWELAFQQVGSDVHDRRRKGTFLTISAFLNHTRISGNLFEFYHTLGVSEFEQVISHCSDGHSHQDFPNWLQLFTEERGWSRLDFEDTLVELRDLSLVQSFWYEDDRVPTFSLHPLVRDWIRTRASVQKRHYCLVQATVIVASSLEPPIQNGEVRLTSYTLHPHLELSEKQALLSHMMACAESIEEDPPYGLRIAVGELEDVGERFARLYDSIGRYRDAQILYELLLESRRKRVGLEDPLVLKSCNQLAFVYRHQGNYEDATSLLQLAADIQERTLGLNDTRTLVSIANVAVSLWYQGKYQDAEKLDRRALEARERVHGPDHPFTLSSVSNLALTLQYQGKFGEAEEMHNPAMLGRQRQAHIDDMCLASLFISMGNLGNFLNTQGEELEAENKLESARRKYDEAEQLYRRVLWAQQSRFGESHPETLIILSSIADILRRLEHLDVLNSQGDSLLQVPEREYMKAEAAYQDVLEKRTSVLGELHPHTLESLENLIMVYRDQLRFDEAAILRRKVVGGYEALRGKKHCETLSHIQWQVELMDMMTEQTEAIQLQRRVFEGYRELYGIDDDRTCKAASNLSALEAEASSHGLRRQEQQKPKFRERSWHRGNRQGYN